MFVDVIESFIPSYETFLLERYDLPAETAPEATLSIAADAVLLALVSYNFLVFDKVVVFQMSLELFSTMEDLGTLIDTAAGVRLMAAPSLNLIMPCVLVSLPVILAAKGSGARGERTAIGAGVALLVLPGHH